MAEGIGNHATGTNGWWMWYTGKRNDEENAKEKLFTYASYVPVESFKVCPLALLPRTIFLTPPSRPGPRDGCRRRRVDVLSFFYRFVSILLPERGGARGGGKGGNGPGAVCPLYYALPCTHTYVRSAARATAPICYVEPPKRTTAISACHVMVQSGTSPGSKARHLHESIREM